MDKLLKRLAEIEARMTAIVDSDASTPEARTALDAEMTKLTDEVKSIQARIAMVKTMQSARADAGTVQPVQAPAVLPSQDAVSGRHSNAAVQARDMAVSQAQLPDGLKQSAEARDGLAEEVARCRAFGRFVQQGRRGISDVEYDRLLCSPQCEGPKDVVIPRSIVAVMVPFTRPLGGHLVRALDLPWITSQTSGQALNPVQYIPEVQKMAPDAVSIWNVARVLNAPAGSAQWPKLTQADMGSKTDFGAEYGGVVVTLPGEGVAGTGSRPDLTMANISTYKYTAWTKVSLEMYMRSQVAVLPFLQELFSGAYTNATECHFMWGTGSNQPEGLVTGITRTVARQVNGDIEQEDLTGLEFAVHPRARANGRYLLADTTLRKVKEKKDDEGRPLYVKDFATGLGNAINGYPWQSTVRQNQNGNSGDVIFGDFRTGYVIAQSEQMIFRMSQDTFITEGNNAVVLIGWAGGEVVETRALAQLVPVGS